MWTKIKPESKRCKERLGTEPTDVIMKKPNFIAMFGDANYTHILTKNPGPHQKSYWMELDVDFIVLEEK